MGIVADVLVATFNPQLAAWSHSPFAIEVERHLIRTLGFRFGYDPARADGTFAAGGMEANHSVVLTALAATSPQFAQKGARALSSTPTLYVSEEAHHSLLKAARLCGLGSDAVRKIPVGEEFKMNPQALGRA
jgi:glutamate/tyrosine decarboxylase-like PLP-dependent enzyme